MGHVPDVGPTTVRDKTEWCLGRLRVQLLRSRPVLFTFVDEPGSRMDGWIPPCVRAQSRAGNPLLREPAQRARRIRRVAAHKEEEGADAADRSTWKTTLAPLGTFRQWMEFRNTGKFASAESWAI